MKLTLLFINLLCTLALHAEGEAWKTIELEWEPVENAGGYEVKLTPKDGGTPRTFSVPDPHLAQEVPVGTYLLQVRSRAKDDDNFSPWSKPSTIEVEVKEILPLFPEDQAVIDTDLLGKKSIEFKWSEIEKVKSYTLKVWSEDKIDTPWVFTGTQSGRKLEVPPGKIYHWQVSFESASETSYNQQPKTFSFTLLGHKLLTPEFVDLGPTLKWKPSPDATSYHAKLLRRYIDETEWTEIDQKTIRELDWGEQKLKPGAYKIEVVAKAPHRQSSEPAVKEFLVKPLAKELLQAVQRAP